MNIVILTSKDHLYANNINKFLIESFPEDIKLVIESSAIFPGKSKLSELFSYLKTAGFYYVFFQGLRQIIFKFLSVSSGLFRKKNFYCSYKKLLEKNKVKNWEKLQSRKELVERIKEARPDIILSILSKYILKNDILDIPKYAFNLHPSYLPYFRGVSPCFWVLAKNEKKTGVSLHLMDERVDHGVIISQEEFEIGKEDTEHSVYLKASEKGKILLKDLIDSIIKREFLITQNFQRKGSYFSFPDKYAVKNFRKNKRRFFTLKEIISIY